MAQLDAQRDEKEEQESANVTGNGGVARIYTMTQATYKALAPDERTWKDISFIVYATDGNMREAMKELWELNI